MHSKRQLLLGINQQLEARSQQDNEEEDEVVEVGKRNTGQTSDLIEDMMVLNEEVEEIEGRVRVARTQLQQLGMMCAVISNSLLHSLVPNDRWDCKRSPN